MVNWFFVMNKLKNYLSTNKIEPAVFSFAPAYTKILQLKSSFSKRYISVTYARPIKGVTNMQNKEHNLHSFLMQKQMLDC